MRFTTGRTGKFLLLALVMVLALALVAGCGGGQQAADKGGDQGKAGEQAQGGGAKAEDDLAFYNGKTVTWIVSTKAGGGYDGYARMLAPYLQKYLPGSTVIVKNVPGAGHIVGVNELYKAKPDGLTIGIFNAGLITQQLAGAEGVQFDLNKLTFLGNAISTQRIFIVGNNTPYKTFDDVLKNSDKVKLSSAGVGSASHNDVLMLNKIFGAKMKPIPGFSGQEGDLAMMRGEVDGQIGQSDQMDTLIENNQAHAVLVIGAGDLDKTKYPDAVKLTDVAPDSGKSLANLMVAIAALSRPIAAPPDLPEGKAKVLREALWKAMNDPDLQAAAKQSKLYVEPQDAQKTAELFKNALNQPAEVVELVKEIVKAEAEAEKK